MTLDDQRGTALLNSLAQLFILYEDLRIETFAIASSEDKLKRLDGLSSKYRRNYFLRRPVAPPLEIEGALHRLSKTSECKTTRDRTDNNPIKMVSNAIRFFTIVTNC